MAEQKRTQDVNEKQLAIMKKQLRATRFLLFIMAAVFGLMVYECAVLLPPVLSAVNEIEEVAENLNDEVIPVLSSFDSEALNQAVTNFDKTVQELDIEELNKAVSSLEDTISELNIDELNSAVEGLSSAVEGLSIIGSLFR